MEPHAIFLVDDDADDRELFCEAVKTISGDIACDMAYDGEDALSQLKTSGRRYDLMFLDMNMPRLNGKQVLSELNKDPDLSGIPVVMLSTSLHEKDVTETSALGARGFYIKPSSFSALCTLLRTVLSAEGIV